LEFQELHVTNTTLLEGQTLKRSKECNIFCKNRIFTPKLMPPVITVSDILLDIRHENRELAKAIWLISAVEKTSMLVKCMKGINKVLIMAKQ